MNVLLAPASTLGMRPELSQESCRCWLPQMYRYDVVVVVRIIRERSGGNTGL